MLIGVGETSNFAPIDDLTAYLEEMARCETELREELHAAADQILARDVQLEASLRDLRTIVEALRSEVTARDTAVPVLMSAATVDHSEYEQLIADVREIISRVTPPNATVLAVSRGDNALVEFDGRPGGHFPQTAEGVYAGHYPADSDEAIAHLEQLRSQGARALLFPSTAFWWLDYYAAFRQHLDTHYRRIWSDERCVVYELLASDESRGTEGPGPAEAMERVDGSNGRSQRGQLVDQIREIVRTSLPLGATVIVISAGGEMLHHVEDA